MDRRRFVAGGLLIGAQSAFGHPALRLIEAITKEAIGGAAVGANGARNYLNVGYLGGPLRYTFDAWLRTNDTDGAIIFNPSIGNSFTSSQGVVTGLEYKTINYKGLWVPSIFAQSVQISSGTVPLTSYLDQMLVIRGYGTGIDGHPQNFDIQLKPLAGQPTISGLAADSSTKVFESVQYPGRGLYSSFSSEKNIALNLLSGAKPVHSMMDGIRSTAKTRNLRATYAAAIDLAKARMNASVGTETSSAVSARKSLDNAMALIKKGVGDLDGFWNEAFTRYYNIVHGAMRTANLPGINDAAILSTPGTEAYHSLPFDGSTKMAAPGFDGRKTFSQMVVNHLAEGLALAEYAYANGLVTSLEISPDQPVNLFYQTPTSALMSGLTTSHDMHFTGAYYGMVQTTMMYRGLMAGLLELRDKLKAARSADGTNVWSNTVVQIMSDFNRTGRADGSGSDHGFNQMVTSLFSGTIKSGPEVVGNVARDTGNSFYSGSQGLAAPIAGYDQAGMPNAAAMASTVSQFLNVDRNPWGNVAQPLVTLNGTQLILPYGRGKVIG